MLINKWHSCYFCLVKIITNILHNFFAFGKHIISITFNNIILFNFKQTILYLQMNIKACYTILYGCIKYSKIN